MIGVIVVCLAAAVGITFWQRSGSSGPGFSDDEKVWIKCNNPDCGAEYQMGKKSYFEAIEKNFDPDAETAPPLKCEKCGKLSAYRALKCPYCGTVFIRGIMGQNDLPDRCPKCRRSETEEIRKERLRSRGGG